MGVSQIVVDFRKAERAEDMLRGMEEFAERIWPIV